jgi:hypothetical protein
MTLADTKKVLEKISISPIPVKRKEIFKVVLMDNYKLTWVLETMVDLGLLFRPERGYYDITERGQFHLDWMRGRVCGP